MSGPVPKISPRVAPTVAPPSRTLLWVAGRYLRRYLARHFTALRIARDGPPPALEGPTIFYSNHPAWWDPIVLFLVIRLRYPDWRFHGPIDARALARYRWLERIGLFGIEPDTLAGARRLIATGAQLLSGPRSGLALTAAGRFADVRERPLLLKRGVARLLSLNEAAKAVPIALEYVFWNERLPEVLVRFGCEPVAARGRGLEAIQRELEQALEQNLDALGEAARTRDPERFELLVAGRVGAGLLEDLPQRLGALIRRERFDAAHAALAPPQRAAEHGRKPSGSMQGGHSRRPP